MAMDEMILELSEEDFLDQEAEEMEEIIDALMHDEDGEDIDSLCDEEDLCDPETCTNPEHEHETY